MLRLLSVYSMASAISLASTFPGRGQGLDPKTALSLITNTAHQICYVISDKGSSSSSEVRGEVKAKLSGLAARLGEGGLEGTGGITSDEYQSVLRDELAKSIRDSAACKLKVFESLSAKLLGGPLPQIATTESDDPAVYPETDATRVQSFQFETPPTEIKPGYRKWVRVAPDVWEESYPDGSKHYSYVIKRARVGSCDGTIVGGKFDKDFQSFFPDKNCEEKAFLFRRLSRGKEWHVYVPIETMN